MVQAGLPRQQMYCSRTAANQYLRPHNRLLYSLYTLRLLLYYTSQECLAMLLLLGGKYIASEVFKSD